MKLDGQEEGVIFTNKSVWGGRMAYMTSTARQQAETKTNTLAPL